MVWFLYLVKKRDRIYDLLGAHFLKNHCIPGGPLVKNPHCNAGYMDSILGWGMKIPYAAEQLSP